ncbi:MULTISPECIES: HPr family phosphocarrier protein [Sellimonas]|uniref:HPr family phosphocarrier protein n=1 Tax=Sellimonas caecigallum TaxID=2592333 RepID=A0ABS7L6K2_9FIRM|nr:MULTISPECIES: HPr family phosphocarrier protein [Sellimonas]MBY0758659.1 HPr family phosphocarrier protein [Sellimonas caecigallum]OUP03198.1 phosphocarrier protein HPr [Drancourtella sp. An210]OUP66388.1 phosphocarrier protein HPr [Drancourtella sp. An177]
MEHKREIRLTASDVKEFVTSAEKCDFDIDVFYNRFIVDAKSILGVLSLDLTKTLTVQYAGINPNFEATLNKFCVA